MTFDEQTYARLIEGANSERLTEVFPNVDSLGRQQVTRLNSPWPPPADGIGSALGVLRWPLTMTRCKLRFRILERRGTEPDHQQEGWRGLWIHFPQERERLYPTFYFRPDEMLFSEGGIALGSSLGPENAAQERLGQFEMLMDAFPEAGGYAGMTRQIIFSRSAGGLHIGSAASTPINLHIEGMYGEPAHSEWGDRDIIAFACEASHVEIEWDWS
jgi:hypothetical protein